MFNPIMIENPAIIERDDGKPPSTQKEVKVKRDHIYHFGNVQVEVKSQDKYFTVNIDNDSWKVELFLTSSLPVTGLANLLRQVASELQQIKNNPFGASNIDPEKAESQKSGERAINILSEKISEQFGSSVVVKRIPWESKENLAKQFEFMNKLYIDWNQKASPEQKKVLTINRPLGCALAEDGQYLFMEAIPNAEWVKDIRFSETDGIRVKNTTGVSLTDYPEFLFLIPESEVDKFRQKGRISWDNLGEYLKRIVGVHPDDLAGRNLLVYHDSKTGLRKFCLIDQREKRRGFGF